jgi:hypothetical protein
LSPLVAVAPFCTVSATRFAVASAASATRWTIDVAVTELGEVSLARWRPTMSAMGECLTAILPSPPEPPAFGVPVLAPFGRRSASCRPASPARRGSRSPLPAR